MITYTKHKDPASMMCIAFGDQSAEAFLRLVFNQVGDWDDE